MDPLSDLKIKIELEEYQCQDGEIGKDIINATQDLKNFDSNIKFENVETENFACVETTLQNDSTCLKNIVDCFSTKTGNSAEDFTTTTSIKIEENFDNGFEEEFDPLAADKIEPTTCFYIINEIDTLEEEPSGWKTYPFLCCFCKQFPFYGVESLYEHVKTFHKVTPRKNILYRCNDCKKVLPCYSIFLNHVRTDHHSEWQLCCDICEMTFKDYKNLYSHRYKHVRDRDTGHPAVYVCSTCGLSYPKKRTLDIHYKSSHSFICHICPMVWYATIIELENHFELFHNFECNTCGTIFLCHRSLKEHQKVHRKVMLKCEFCSAVFTTKRILSEHIKEHYAPVKFKCDFCEKEFRRRIGKTLHERTHTEIEKRKVNEMKLAADKKLRKHQSSNQLDNPYNCDKCKKSFECLYKLKIHNCRQRDELIKCRRRAHSDVLAKAFY